MDRDIVARTVEISDPIGLTVTPASHTLMTLRRTG